VIVAAVADVLHELPFHVADAPAGHATRELEPKLGTAVGAVEVNTNDSICAAFQCSDTCDPATTVNEVS
jgi:hypothetical protein